MYQSTLLSRVEQHKCYQWVAANVQYYKLVQDKVTTLGTRHRYIFYNKCRQQRLNFLDCQDAEKIHG